MINGMTADLRDQLKRHSVAFQPQVAVASPEPQTVAGAPPQPAGGNGRTPEPVARKAAQPAAHVEPITQAKERAREAKQAYKQMKTGHFMERHQRLMKGLKNEPLDIRWLAASVNKVGFIV